MTREELLKKILEFEDLSSKYIPLNPLWRFVSVLGILRNINNLKYRKRLDEMYHQLMIDLDSMEVELGAKEYMGWRRRVMSAKVN